MYPYFSFNGILKLYKTVHLALILSLGVLGNLALSSSVHAFGKTGHRRIAELANCYLSGDEQREIKNILGLYSLAEIPPDHL